MFVALQDILPYVSPRTERAYIATELVLFVLDSYPQVSLLILSR